MNVRRATGSDLAEIEAVARWACSDAIGELVPESVVSSELERQFRRSVLSEHILAQRMLVGEGETGRLELVVMIDEYLDHTELTTVVVPTHPSLDIDGRCLVETLRAMGWLGPLRSIVPLGNTVVEQFHETAGFAPGDVVVEDVAGHSVVRREWWLDPAYSVAG